MTARVVNYKQKKTETKIEGRSVIEYFSFLKSPGLNQTTI